MLISVRRCGEPLQAQREQSDPARLNYTAYFVPVVVIKGKLKAPNDAQVGFALWWSADSLTRSLTVAS
jgi:hypothetical protein